MDIKERDTWLRGTNAWQFVIELVFRTCLSDTNQKLYYFEKKNLTRNE